MIDLFSVFLMFCDVCCCLMFVWYIFLIFQIVFCFFGIVYFCCELLDFSLLLECFDLLFGF